MLGPDRPHDGRTRGSTTSLAVSPSDTDGVESDGPSSGSVDGHAVVRKVARHFLPLVGLCYIVLYLDRLNIGFAALTMNDELGISATMFGFVAGVYFWSYTLCEPVSNWVLSRVGARIWISRIMATWGLVTIGTALVQGATSLAVMRFLLGVAEAGFSPGMLYFVSCWFPHARRGMAMSWVVTFICLSGLGTPMMTHMHGLDGFLGLSGWRWIFVLTGIPAVLLALACYRRLRNTPAEADFLSAAERVWLTRTLEEEARGVDGNEKHSFRAGLAEPRVLLLVAVFICVTFSLNGYQLWTAQIFKSFGMSTTEVGWVAAIPPLLAVGPMLWWMRHSDRTDERGWHFCVAAAVAMVGFGVAAVSLSTPAVAVAGFCVAGIGLYTSMAVFISIPASFLTGAALAAGFGVVNGMGNLGGYFGPQVAGWIKDATGGYGLAIGAFGAAMAVAAVLILGLKKATPRPEVTL
ncbi:MFS transporter [Streptomyces albus]|uniref:MFS transporter n=1 Tax=Streptomyces albus (strain ATCC 21838 / DSM 41398 / FERM P-419 / JCM 4703 / NBRC 107858) TaxID=1081613 RepID=A0A0B5EQU9_STRA4|nr:MFS transporter [Streptomyces albus]AOU74849.1 MFS transporter [Streptomyces albus]